MLIDFFTGKEIKEDYTCDTCKYNVGNKIENGQVHTYSELINAMYDVEDNSFYLTNLRTNIMRLNKKIKDFGTIKAIRGVGYKLEVKDE